MHDLTFSPLPVLNLPRAVPLQKERPPKENIPQTREERERLRIELREFVKTRRPVPLHDLLRRALDGHEVTVEDGCTIAADCLIGMGARILNGAVLEPERSFRLPDGPVAGFHRLLVTFPPFRIDLLHLLNRYAVTLRIESVNISEREPRSVP